ncbi:hypothetical protein K5E_06320 [Enterococcus thailandicus]|uniref:DinB-like domain-containing protein n=1 Tax=bioreactor metagenome TaxID=1076179 RepID=A0A645ACP2_9ZZZZ|nr:MULTISPECIES: ClbS/DfsB family four-helix bundle protein [Enterococcus]MDK4351817.1 ClbS/DfsB family four-helix bundle protein [Enterococcus thailandicus]MDT2734250.1 ClbS/DfsB family four-helix bundle protein [Enterococcus thailandicus]MEA4829074.1 ClbS/DfsB family four-helix bundle protein [Enterococcus thailandicus]OTP23769.1 hypothetical protein A5800_001626 [Enterococcus sp. 5B7_DIV0075]GMC08493.1 hypothetical protein K5E_06320 [Enterococcus thailandicus]
MARPKTKTDLMFLAEEKFVALMELVNTLTDEEQKAPFTFDEAFLTKKKEKHWRRDKNIRDVFIHLYEWHQLLLTWVKENQAGQEISFLPSPYNWRTYGEMNEAFVEKHQTTSLEQAKKLLEQSHHEVMTVINSFTNEELFEKNQLSWTGHSTLGSYCVSSTSSHYEWVIKKIKQQIKSKK